MRKAFIENLDTKEQFDVLFNPKEYKVTKTNSYQPAKTSGGNVPPMKFASGQAASMTVQLFFDTYEKKEDVRKYTNKIAALMEVKIRDEGKRNKLRPPRVKFHWGLNWSFKAVITQMSQNFTLFLQNGTPVRATVDITMQQDGDEQVRGSQNPTSGGSAGRRTHMVAAGETLDLIAFQQLGDPSAWRRIAELNRVHDPLNLTPGRVLVVETED